MQILIPAALALLSFNIAEPGQKAVSRSMFNVAAPPTPTVKPLEYVLGNTSDVLKGIKGVRAAVNIVNPDAAAVGLSKDGMTNRVELALRRNGIQVYTFEEMRQADGQPYLFVDVNVVSSIASIDVTCYQSVRSTARPDVQIIGASVWRQGTMGGAGRITEGIDQLLDTFCNDFLKANLK